MSRAVYGPKSLVIFIA